MQMVQGCDGHHWPHGSTVPARSKEHFAGWHSLLHLPAQASCSSEQHCMLKCKNNFSIECWSNGAFAVEKLTWDAKQPDHQTIRDFYAAADRALPATLKPLVSALLPCSVIFEPALADRPQHIDTGQGPVAPADVWALCQFILALVQVCCFLLISSRGAFTHCRGFSVIPDAYKRASHCQLTKQREDCSITALN